jgi:hypothetical protein
MFTKKMGEGISGFLFSLFLATVLLVYTVSYLTSFETLQPVVSDVAQEQQPPQQMDESQLQEVKKGLLAQCSNSTTGIIEVPLEENRTAKLSCSELQSVNESKQLFGMVAKDVFKETYYKDYGCSFIECLTREGSDTDKLTVLLSETSHKFLESLKIFVVIATIGFGILFAYFSGRPSKMARNFGWAFTLLGSSFIITEIMKLKKQTAEGTASTMLKVMDTVLARFQIYFIALFVAGIILLVVGYVWAYYETR